MAGWARLFRLVLLVAGLLTLTAWLAGWCFTDRWIVTQIAWWGGLPLLVAAAGLSTLRLIVGKWTSPAGLPSAPTPGRSVRRFVKWWPEVFILIACFLEGWHQFNLRSIQHPTEGGAARPLHIVHCNLGVEGTSREQSDAFARRLVEDGEPDILLISIANYPVQWAAIRSAMGESPALPVGVHEGLSGKIFSRWPVVMNRSFVVPTQREWALPLPNWARDSIESGLSVGGVRGRNLERFEPASIQAVTLDTTAAVGRRITVYFVDYPSSPTISRAAVAAAVRQRMNQMMNPTIPGEKPIPPPDLIIGDFNTPRGSASLRSILPGFAPATDAAGLGLLGTFPRATPLLHIDNALVSLDWRTTAYTTIDPGIGEHRAQSLRISPAP